MADAAKGINAGFDQMIQTFYTQFHMDYSSAADNDGRSAAEMELHNKVELARRSKQRALELLGEA